MSDVSETITDFCEGDEQEINALYREVFGGRRSLEEWRWKFRGHPFPHLAMISKLVREGRIIGHVGSLPAQFKVGDQLVLGGQIVDYLIHPSFQLGKRSLHINQELSTRMKDRFVEQGIAFGYGFPNALSYPVAMKYIQHAEDLTEIPVWKKCLRPPSLRRADSEGESPALLGRIHARALWHLRQLTLPRRPLPDSRLVLTPMAGPDRRLDDLWQEASKHIGIARVRDQKHIAWRFFDKPGRDYSFRLLQDRDETLAYGVTAVKERGLRTGYLIDCLFRPENGILESLLRLLLRQMAEERIDVVKCLSPADSPVAEVLKTLGFRQEPDGVKMIAWILTPSIDRSYFFDRRNWHLTYADLDGT